MPKLSSELASHLQTGEHIRLTIPGIWVIGHSTQQEQQGQDEQRRSSTCDIVLTNQRIIGYAHIRFPRERLFLEAFPLNSLTAVSLRQKSYEPLFHELLISDGTRRAYIRSSRPRIEQLYAALRPSTPTVTPYAVSDTSSTNTPGTAEVDTDNHEAASQAAVTTSSSAPVYGRQDVRRSFEQSPLGITVLFVGGLLLEVLGVLLWIAISSAQIGLPLCLAGFVCVIAATVQRRRHRL